VFSIHYLNSQGGVVSKETSAADRLTDAVAGAKRSAKEMHGALGFIVFDATGEKALHREFLG
jgi:hypothetical protein